jgi:YD repeat-containing protein
LTQDTAVVSLTYDDADRRASLNLPNGIVVTYGYDDTDQLTALTYSLGPVTLGTLTYTYDAAGNRTTVGGTWARTGLPQAMASATYDAANQIAESAGQYFSYDLNGNLASDGLNSFNWNARNGRVCQVVEKFRRVIIQRDDVTTLPFSPPSYPDSHRAFAT